MAPLQLAIRPPEQSSIRVPTQPPQVTVTTGALTLSSTNANTIHIDAFGTAAINWDKLTSTAAIALGNTASTLQVNIASGLNFTAGQTYVSLMVPRLPARLTESTITISSLSADISSPRTTLPPDSIYRCSRAEHMVCGGISTGRHRIHTEETCPRLRFIRG